MPARDIYHDTVKAALLNDGWTITHDPYHVACGGREAYVDLGAERESVDMMLAAERGVTRIAVEIKPFIGVGGFTAGDRTICALPYLDAQHRAGSSPLSCRR